jgi:hypothetical protein
VALADAAALWPSRPELYALPPIQSNMCLTPSLAGFESMGGEVEKRVVALEMIEGRRGHAMCGRGVGIVRAGEEIGDRLTVPAGVVDHRIERVVDVLRVGDAERNRALSTMRIRGVGIHRMSPIDQIRDARRFAQQSAVDVGPGP